MQLCSCCWHRRRACNMTSVKSWRRQRFAYSGVTGHVSHISCHVRKRKNKQRTQRMMQRPLNKRKASLMPSDSVLSMSSTRLAW